MRLELREIDDTVLDELRRSVVLPPEQAAYVGGPVDNALAEAAAYPEATRGRAGSTSTVCRWVW